MSAVEAGIRLDVSDGARLLAGHSSSIREIDNRLREIHELFSLEGALPTHTLARYGRAWTRSHLQEGDLRQVVDLADRAREECAVLVTIGIGGSDLGARVFHDVLNPAYHNLLSADERGGAPEVYFAGIRSTHAGSGRCWTC